MFSLLITSHAIYFLINSQSWLFSMIRNYLHRCIPSSTSSSQSNVSANTDERHWQRKEHVSSLAVLWYVLFFCLLE
ncbi:unnamed protein product, partial [Amoebophrya sp. A25]|eukprot:GSA25T00025958001.1